MLIGLICAVALAWLIQSLAYRKSWDRGLEVKTAFADSWAYEGETGSLREEVVNDKWLPLPALEVRLAVSRGLVFEGEARENSSVTDQSYRRDIFSLLPRQKVVRTLDFRCRRRGYYRITRAEVVGRDLFYGQEYYREWKQETGFYVYPGRVDIRRIRFLYQAVSGMILSKSRLYPDPFAFSGIREYAPSDPMNRINWKASAKSQSIMVNQLDSTTSIRASLFLDVEDSGIWKHESLTEEGIRVAASLAEWMVKNGMELELWSNGKSVCEGERCRELRMHLKAGGGSLGELNRRLSCLETGSGLRQIEELLWEEGAPAAESLYIVISKERPKAALGGRRILWIMLCDPGEEESEEEAGRGIPGIWTVCWRAQS